MPMARSWMLTRHFSGHKPAANKPVMLARTLVSPKGRSLMALEPYRPPADNRYRDELDREIDQKLDKVFNRWRTKLWRFVRRAIFFVAVLYLFWNYVSPTLFGWLTQGNPVLDTLMFAFQMVFMIS